jgi:hypothetical protein
MKTETSEKSAVDTILDFISEAKQDTSVSYHMAVLREIHWYKRMGWIVDDEEKSLIDILNEERSKLRSAR